MSKRGPRRRPIEERFWPKVAAANEDGCLIWTGAKTTQGYGSISLGGHQGKTIEAHRWAYEQGKGPVPEGLELDHLCRNRLCVEVTHMEAVTHQENVLRGEAPPAQQARQESCIHGHLFDKGNTYIRPDGKRHCRTCGRDANRKHSLKQQKSSTEVFSEPAEQRLGDWPYRLVQTPDDLIALAEWLQKLGAEEEKTPVGIAANSEELAFATNSQGWLLRINHSGVNTPFSYARDVMKKLLTTERGAPALVTRDTGALVMILQQWLGTYDRDALLSSVKHDMLALEYTTGRPIARDITPLKDALDCAVVGPAMALEAPRFYQQVGLPLIQHNAKRLRFDLEEGPPSEGLSRWTLTYDWLLFRVLAYYTHDPTFKRWFQDGQNPLEMFSQAVELDSKEAVTFLLWMVCGEEEELVSRYYPDWAANMPETPQLIKASRVDKTLPNFRLGLLRLTDQSVSTRKTTTLYGRQSPWGLRPAELLHFSIMGSVNDLLDVAVASIINMGSEQHWLVPEKNTRYNHWLRATVMGYTKEEPMKWQQQLEQIGGLNNPLGDISLEPKVAVE